MSQQYNLQGTQPRVMSIHLHINAVCATSSLCTNYQRAGLVITMSAFYLETCWLRRAIVQHLLHRKKSLVSQAGSQGALHIRELSWRIFIINYHPTVDMELNHSLEESGRWCWEYVSEWWAGVFLVHSLASLIPARLISWPSSAHSSFLWCRPPPVTSLQLFSSSTFQ